MTLRRGGSALLTAGLLAAFGACGDDTEPASTTTASTSTSSSTGGTAGGGAEAGGGAGATGGGGSSSGGAGGAGGAGGGIGGTGGIGVGGAGGGGQMGCTKTAAGATRGSPIAISPDDSTLVVANRDVGTVSVIGVDWSGGLPAMTKKVEIAVGGEPWQVAIDGCGTTAYVVLRKDQKLVEITDLAGAPAKGAEISVGAEPTGLAITPNNGFIYVANWVDGTVTKVDAVAKAAVGTIDLNPALAGTGLLGASVSAQASRAALAHPRSLAITNDGDAQDDDEKIFVTEFFGQRTAPEAADGSNVDENWIGVVYRIAAADDSVGIVNLASMPITGYLNHKGETTGCFPNQLQSVTIEGDRAFVTSICASPKGPVGPFQKKACTTDAQCTDAGSTCDVATGACTLQCLLDADCGSGSPAGTCVLPAGACKAIPTNVKTMTHPVVHAIDTATETVTSAGPQNLNAELDVVYAGAGTPDTNVRRYPHVANDIGFVPGSGEAYVTANGADGVFRVTFDAPTGDVSGVGTVARAFVDLGNGLLAPEKKGENPLGLAVAHAHAYAFVTNDVSRNVAAIDLDPTKQDVAGASTNDARVIQSTDLPVNATELSILRGKRAFNTGVGRWSLKGQAWGSCQHCHFEGLSDNVTWYFARGPRQSTSLDGSFASNDPTDQRIFNWTSVFDEIADFENVARGLNGAVGGLVHTISDPPVNADRINLGSAVAFPPSGAANLHGSAQEVSDTQSLLKTWDDVKAYIQALRSPRAPTNLAAVDVTAGQTLFADAMNGGNCAGCHGGAKWTVSKRFYVPSGAGNAGLLTAAYDPMSFPNPPAPAGSGFKRSPNPFSGALDQIQCVLRPVGTFDVSPPDVDVLEKRQDMVATAQGDEAIGKGYNVPSLLGLSVGAPYFHAGNARTLEELLDALFAAHTTALVPTFAPTAAQKAQIVAFLLSIDESTTTMALPGAPFALGGDFCP